MYTFMHVFASQVMLPSDKDAYFATLSDEENLLVARDRLRFLHNGTQARMSTVCELFNEASKLDDDFHSGDNDDGSGGIDKNSGGNDGNGSGNDGSEDAVPALTLGHDVRYVTASLPWKAAVSHISQTRAAQLMCSP
jgi:hypothetical protein